MQPIRTLIIDDEPLAREILESHAAQIPELEVLASCGNALEANEIVQSTEVDLLFLDIQMPQISGLDWLRSLRTPPLVIFTTAFSEYAVEGFELNAIDYLLKPIAFDRFLKAVNKAKEQLRSRKPEAGSDQYMFVKADKKLVKVSFEDIVYIEGLKDYVIIRLEQDRVITLQTMKSLEEKLPQNIFRRIHRSYIVNVDKIEAIVGNMVEVMEKNQAKHLPIGKNYREELLEIINKNRL